MERGPIHFSHYEDLERGKFCVAIVDNTQENVSAIYVGRISCKADILFAWGLAAHLSMESDDVHIIVPPGTKMKFPPWFHVSEDL